MLRLDGRGALFEQLARALKTEILEGRYAAGKPLPSTRALAEALGLSRNTVLGAYELLCAENLAAANPGRGTLVSAAAAGGRAGPREQPIAPQSRYSARARELGPITLAGGKGDMRYDLQYGSPSVRPQLFISWRRKQVAAAARVAPQYPTSAGLHALRVAIADYVLRRRGVSCTSEDVIVVGGTQQALTLTARVVLDEGQSVVVEDPHYQLLHHALLAHGARLVPVRVDAEGLVVCELPKKPPRMIALTPAHQFPSGVVMSLSRRVEVLNYAERHECWVFEDDYDGELHYDGRPLPALRSLDRGKRVIYTGTFSKTLFPGLRLGYIVCPPALRDDFIRAKIYDDLGCSAIEQSALATFIESGQYEKHLRQSLTELRSRRKAILGGLAPYLADHVTVTSNGGMHVVAWLRSLSYQGCDSLVARAAARGVGLHGIERFFLTRPAQPGLMLGFAGLTSEQLAVAMSQFSLSLDETLREADGTSQTRKTIASRRG
jgi:GntR family transcriptional regulator/MocR family aminotransferase